MSNNQKKLSSGDSLEKVRRIAIAPEDNHLSRRRIVGVAKVCLPLFISVYLWSKIFHNTYYLVSNINQPKTGILIYERTFFIIISVLMLCVSLFYLYRFGISDKIKNTVLMLYSFIIFFLIAEIVFMYKPVSQGDGRAYCAYLWFHKYWTLNERGYRDIPYNPQTDTQKHAIVMLGDSYVAGQGIKDVNNRMSNLLQAKLGEQYRVFNLGKNGANSRQEFRSLQDFPYKYEKLILVHVPNDLDYIEQDNAAKKQQAVQVTSDVSVEHTESGIIYKVVSFLKMESFFFNFLSYSPVGDILSQIFHSDTGESSGIKPKHLYPFEDSLVTNQQVINMKWLDSLEHSNRVEMIIVSFPPREQDMVKAEKYYDIFISKLTSSGLDVMDVNPIYKRFSTSEQTVGLLDGHPSERINKVVADSLYNLLKSKSWF